MEDEFAARLAKVDEMRARGDDPYPVRFDRTHHLMVVIGPQGSNLKKDVDLRLENSATIL